ncbi:PREDICTED: NKG2D ligand 2-like [Ceratotherium simum simum]|uniref:NKG2D ligand 2-like n=1 Tax=Ceratotherium simum simum TaxID=73337 RepID=A0ABM1DGL4_CERSS|nr:PREDICTED: NKG2D ligand 2-like [Ceratotherium simum simum]
MMVKVEPRREGGGWTVTPSGCHREVTARRALRTAESPSPLQVATAPTAGPEFSLRLLLALLLLRRDCHWAARGDAGSLCYDFTIIPEPRPGQARCEVQGQVDGKTFLSYDCGRDEVKSLSLLGEEVNGTRAWQEQLETLRDVGDLLRQQLPNIQPEKYTDRDALPMQGRMMCQRKANGRTSASWQFGFHGQMFLLFGSENGTWTVLQPGGRRMRDMWESDRDVTEFFRNISMGDCRRWLENFLVHGLKTQETTGI